VSADAGPLRALLATPEVAAWWGPVPDGFPLDEDPDVQRWTIVAEDSVAGMVQHGEEPDPDYRHAWIDLFVDPRLHSRGYGSDAVATICRHLIGAEGHHRITIDPAADNAAAIRCYRKAGFREVGVMHSAWRDPATRAWRDLLLMELVRLRS
jgi:aminoglycoside 6'-N-acetyltransferase